MCNSGLVEMLTRFSEVNESLSCWRKCILLYRQIKVYISSLVGTCGRERIFYFVLTTFFYLPFICNESQPLVLEVCLIVVCLDWNKFVGTCSKCWRRWPVFISLSRFKFWSCQFQFGLLAFCVAVYTTVFAHRTNAVLGSTIRVKYNTGL